MTEFTKGPWVIDAGEKNDRSHLITTNNRSVINNMAPICEIETDFIGEFGVEQKANAHLIAAAPAMYAMIEMLANELYQAIDECNDQRLSHITSMTETPPDLIDMESIHLAQLLLKKARGE